MDINTTMKLYVDKSDMILYEGECWGLLEGKYISQSIKASTIDSVESFNKVLASDFPIIEGLLTDFIPETFEEYLKLVDESRTNMKFYKLEHLFKEGDNFINLFHKLQPGEVEDFYESSMSLVINGHEWDEYEDGVMPNRAIPFYATGYVFREEINHGGIINIVPPEFRIDFPLLYIENRRCSFTYISKACIDKAILYKRFKDPATIGTSESYRAYTGKVETLELDFYNIDEAVLQEFIKHGVIRPQNKPLEEKEVAEQVAFAREQAVLSQEAYKDWLNKNEAL